MSDVAVEQLAGLSGAEETTRISSLGLFLLRGAPSAAGTQDLMDRLWHMHAAVDMMPNYVGSLTAAFNPDDPQTVNGNQWHVEQASGVDLDLPRAWGELTRGSDEITVAVPDSGLKPGHPEFAGRLFVNSGEIPGNELDDDGNGYVDDVSGWNTLEAPSEDVTDLTSGHGTYVSALLLANTDNAFQVAGVDHHAKLLPLKIGDAFSSGGTIASALIGALDYLVANPKFAQVVNMSAGGFPETSMLSEALSAAAKTHILIAGSGNSEELGLDGCDFLPASHSEVITVGATDRTDTLGSFSSTGPCVDFVAPGVAVTTASFEDSDNPSAFHTCDGTSFAAPQISGFASLAHAIRQGSIHGNPIESPLSRSDFYAALQASAVDLGPPGKDDGYGWGRPNAYEALKLLAPSIFQDGFETGDTSRWN